MKRLVLVGAGHAHALVLRAWARAPLPGVAITIVSPQAQAPYSGLVPAWLAGRIAFDDLVIDGQHLAAAAGARWQPGELDRLDTPRRQVHLADGSSVPYDVLSLNVGSTLRPPPLRHATVLPLRPLAELRRRWERLLADAAAAPSDDTPLTVTAAGSGPAGFEALLAVLARWRTLQPRRPVRGELFTLDASLLPSLSAPARRAAQAALQRAGVALHLNTPWTDALDQPGRLLLWATGAEAHDWQRDPARRGGLAVDARGFIAISPQLQSLSHAEVFASGDCAAWPGAGLPKAGVHAVRMAPVLAHNLRAALGAEPALRAHEPQRRMLALLATADGRAIASRGPFGAEGRWVLRWKDHIDQRFVAGLRTRG
jgi:NADH dehydrogenase FAD-containing subunit